MRQLTVKTPYGTITRFADVPYKFVAVAVVDGRIAHTVWSRTREQAITNIKTICRNLPCYTFPVPEQAHDTH